MRNLYLPLEIVVRELDGKLLLAVEAFRKGWNVIVSKKTFLFDRADLLPRGIFILKSITISETSQIMKLKEAGHLVFVLDEEGLVTYADFINPTNKVRFAEETLKLVEGVFFWGTAQKNMFLQNSSLYKNLVHVTGNPRVDFWSEYAQKIYSTRIAKIKEIYGDFILFPTSFGISNNFSGGKKGYELSIGQNKYLSNELKKFFIEQYEFNLITFKEYVYLLAEIAQIFESTKLIVRTHPSESSEIWNNLSAEYPNIECVYEGSVTPWLLASSGIIHFKSTTSIEAYFYNKDVITLNPPYPEYMKKFELPIVEKVSKVSKSRVEFINDFRLMLNNQLDYKKSLDNNFLNFEKELSSSESILEKLDDIDLTDTKVICPKSLNDSALRSTFNHFRKIITYRTFNFSYSDRKEYNFNKDYIKNFLNFFNISDNVIISDNLVYLGKNH